jgi:hypothetical protein
MIIIYETARRSKVTALNDDHACRNASPDKIAMSIKGQKESYKPASDDDFKVNASRNQAMPEGKKGCM